MSTWRDKYLTELESLAGVGRGLAARGWCPATSSNFSLALPDGMLAISQSGKDKSCLSVDDLMLIDRQAEKWQPEAAKPSAETLIHIMLYRLFDAGAVLHTHSKAATLLSLKFLSQGEMRFSDYEILKGLAGNGTHEMIEVLPVLPNDQDMSRFCDLAEPLLGRRRKLHGFLMAGHGLYSWGKNLFEAQRHIETFEFLLECELEKLRWRD